MSVLLLLLLLVHSALQNDISCSTDAECPQNATCLKATSCVCKDGYSDDEVDDVLVCLKDKSIGDDCQKDKECEDQLGTFSECRPKLNGANGTCQCQLTYHFSGGSCRKDKYLGESCTSKDDCVNSNPDVKVHCQNGTCGCPVGFHASSNKSECAPDARIDSVCEEDSDCFVANSVCRGRCHCTDGYVTNNNKTKCLPVSNSLEAPCMEDNQCTVNMKLTSCINGVCNCVSYSHRIDGKCYMTRDLGGSCQYDLECMTKSNNRSTFGCIDHKCKCRVNYKPSDGDCVRKSGSSPLEIYSLLLALGLFVARMT